MKAFWAIIRQALGYRAAIAMSVVCSVMIGLLWGANIGTLYPVIEVVFRGESLAESFERNIHDCQAQIDSIRTELAEIDAAAPDDGEAGERRKSLLTRLDAENRSLDSWQSMLPWATRYLPADPMSTLLVVIAVMLVGTILKGVFISLNEILVSRVTLRTMFDMRKRFYRRALQWDLATFSEDRSSRLMSRFTHDLTRVGQGLQTVFGQALHEPMKIAVCLTGAALICWRLLLASLIFAPLGFLVIRFISRAARRHADGEMSAMADVYAHLAESFRGIKAVLAFNRRQQERRKFHGLAKKLLQRRMHASAWKSLVKPTGEIISTSMVSVAVVLGAYLVVNRETQVLGITLTSQPLTASTLMLFYAFLLGASDPMRKLSGISIQLIRTAAAADRVMRMMERRPAIASPKVPVPFPKQPKRLVFDEVKFRYRQGEDVLRCVNLEIELGQRVALVGPNGCGKSTLIDLISRFHDPKSGSIRIDETDIRRFRIEDLRHQIALVPQEGVLFDDTVMNNIRYGWRHATDEQVIAAAKQARAHEFITGRLAEGYDTVIGEGGCMLSGGQRQRLALARACLRDAPIWILDESTSNVDVATKDEFRHVLARHLRNRTAIIVTHQPEDLMMADRIIVMQEGQVVDAGTHDQLMLRCEYYRRLHRADLRIAA